MAPFDEKPVLPNAKMSSACDSVTFEDVKEVDNETIPSKGSNRSKKFVREFMALKFQWITKNLDFPHLIPVLRGAVAGWLSLLLMVIQGTEHVVGQVRYPSRFPAKANHCLTYPSHYRPASLCY